MLQDPIVCKNFESNPIPNKSIHDGHWGQLPYDNNGIKKRKLDETNTFISIFSLNIRAPFCTHTFTSTKITFLQVHFREKEYSSLTYNMYASASNNTPSYTHVSLYML